MPLLQESEQVDAASSSKLISDFDQAKEGLGKGLVETLVGPTGELIYSGTHVVMADNTLKTEEEHWLTPTIRTAQIHPRDLDLRLAGVATKAAAGTAVEAAKVGLDAAKLAWEIIKDSKATAITADVKSSVLSQNDTDPLSYSGAKEGDSGDYTWVINDSFDWFGTINYITVRIGLQGSWDASPSASSSAPPGLYLPSLYFNVKECTVNFPCYLNGTANLETPTNIGTADRTNASIVAHAKLTGGWLVQSIGISVKFLATGSGGFSLLGKE